MVRGVLWDVVGGICGYGRWGGREGDGVGGGGEAEDVKRRGQVFVRDLVFTRGLVQRANNVVVTFAKRKYRTENIHSLRSLIPHPSSLNPNQTSNLLLAPRSCRTQDMPRSQPRERIRALEAVLPLSAPVFSPRRPTHPLNGCLLLWRNVYNLQPWTSLALSLALFCQKI